MPLLPTRKQIFSRAIAEHMTNRVQRPNELVAAGIIDPAGLDREHNAMMLARIAAVETWLLGCRERYPDLRLV